MYWNCWTTELIEVDGLTAVIYWPPAGKERWFQYRVFDWGNTWNDN